MEEVQKNENGTFQINYTLFHFLSFKKIKKNTGA